MESLHYNDWRIVVNESLVRAAVIVYFYEHALNQFAMKTLEIETMGNGFPWMLDAVAAPDFVDFCRFKFWYLIISRLENNFWVIWVTHGFFVPLQHVRAKEEKPFWVRQRSGG